MEVNVGMVFAMIFVLIIIGFILAVGLDQILVLFDVGGQAQMTKAVKDLEKITEEVYLYSEGSSKTYMLSIPSSSRLCFVNKEDPGPQTYTEPERTWFPDKMVLEQFLKNPESQYYGSNIWMYKQGDEFGEGYEISHLSPAKSFCTRGGTKLFLVNKGYSVDISYIE
jgi:hypothetical protein